MRAEDGVFFKVQAVEQAIGVQEAVGRNAKARVMVKAAPVSALEVVEPKFLFQFLVVALDAPATFDSVDQLLARDVRWQGTEKVLGGLGLTFWPFDEQSLWLAWCIAKIVSMSRCDTHGCERRGEFGVGSLTPCELAVG